MRRYLGAVVPLGLLLGAASPPPAATVRYDLAPVMESGAIVALDVTIRLRADASGTTVIDWDEEWAGERKLGQWARDVRVAGATSTAPAPHGGRIVRSAGGAALEMRYRVVSAYDVDPGVGDTEQPPPIVRPGWFYAVGEVLYARPAGRDDAPADFRWHGPRGIGFASDTEHVVGLNRRPRSVEDIGESIAIGGRDLKVASAMLDGAPVRVAHVGRFDFDVAAFETMAQRIVAAERGFWRDTAPGPFLITAIPLVPKPGFRGFSGTGRSDAFATWLQRDADLPSLGQLLAHEYFHSWNARQLGALPAGRAAEAYWLSEGFTDFYARRLMLRAGLSRPEEFAATWNEMLRAYAVSPWRATGNAEVAAKYWSGDYAAQKMQYQRGALLAAWWDRRLRAAGAGLDAVLRDQRDRARTAAERPDLVVGFTEAAARAGLDVRPDLARYVDAGAPVLLPADAFGPCVRVETADVAVFERGWNAEATSNAGNVVTGLDPASNAYAAGLRDGMKIVGRSAGEPGNSAVDYVLKVEEGGTPRTITFRPAGKAVSPTQRLVLDAARFAAEPERCRLALAG